MVRTKALRNLVFLATAILAVATFSGNSEAFRATDSRIEVIPEGTEWVLGHQGDLSFGVISPLPAEFAAQNGDGRWFQRLTGPHGEGVGRVRRQAHAGRTVT